MLETSVQSTRVRSIVFPLAVCAALAALSLYETTFHKVGRDQGGWSYAGWAWEAHGLAPYSGTMDNKTPGIHLLYAIFVRYFGVGVWPHAVTAAAALIVTSLLVYRLGTRLYGRTAGELGMLLFALTIPMPSLDGALYVEPFVIMFSTASFYCVLTSRGATGSAGVGRLLLAGAGMGLAIYFKQTAIFAALALCIACAVLARSGSRSWGNAAASVAAVLAGILLATLLGLIPLLAGGTSLRQYWQGGWLLLLKPGTAAKLTNRIYNFVIVWGGMKAKMPLFYPLVLLFVLLRERLKANAVPYGCLLTWLVLEFLGANASGQLWGHQVQQVVPVLAVISGIAVSAALQTVFAEERQRRLGRSLIVVSVLVLWAPIDLFDAACFRYYQKAKGEVAAVDKPKQLGLWLKQFAPADESTFVWSADAGTIYAYAEKVAPSRFFHNHFAGNAEAVAEIRATLLRNPPSWVVVEKDPYPAIPAWLQEWIDKNYSRRDEKFGYVILERRETK